MWELGVMIVGLCGCFFLLKPTQSKDATISIHTHILALIMGTESLHGIIIATK